jgi:hypothetical protein
VDGDFVPFVLALESPSAVARADIVAAFDLADDDGAGPAVFEIGRPATGATCVLLEEPGVPLPWRLALPLVRAPWAAGDLLPGAHAAAVNLGAAWRLVDDQGRLTDHLLSSLDDLRRAHDLLRRRACAEALRQAGADPAALPPHAPAADLAAVHGWLVAAHDRAARDRQIAPLIVAATDPAAADPRAATFATLVDAPDRRVAPVPAIFFDGWLLPLGERPADADGFVRVDAEFFATARAVGRPASALVLCSAVEVVDDETLWPTS